MMGSVGPIFEGMPLMRFNNNPIDWKFISKDILSHYTQKLPFKFFVDKGPRQDVDANLVSPD